MRFLSLVAGMTAALLGPVAADAASTVASLSSGQVVSNVPFTTQIAAARAMGLGRVRMGVYWSEVEKTKGAYDWKSTDSRMRIVQSNGLVPILTVFGRNPLYQNAGSADPQLPPASGEALTGYARFAAAVVQHYGTGAASRPITYEIWNEPNTKTFWGVAPDPEGYSAMASSACRAMKAANGNARVLGLAMEGTPVKAPYYVAAYGVDIYRQWADRAASPALMQCVDGISMHPYRPIPESYVNDESALQQFVKAHWSRSTPPIIVNSEWGYNIDVKAGRLSNEQAALDLRTLLVGVGSGRITNLYQLNDTGTNLQASDQTYGLYANRGGAKPAGDAVRRLLSLIGSYEVDRIDRQSADPSVFRFTARRGRGTATILWTTSDTLSAALPASADGRSRILNLITGAAVAAQGKAIAVGPEPILILSGS